MDKSGQQKRSDAEACFHRALRDQKAGRLEAAKRAYEEILANDSNHAGAIKNLAAVDAVAGELVEALRLYDRAIALQPGDPDAHNNRGLILEKLDREQEALACFDRALELRNDYPQALNNKGVVLERLERPGEALASYEKALALDPAFKGAALNRGAVLRRMGRYDASLSTYETILESAPKNANALLGRALTERRQGNNEAALVSCRAALLVDPENGEALASLGSILRDLGRTDEAMAVLDRAIALDPENTLQRFKRALLLLSLGQFEEGWRDYEWRLRQKGAVKEPRHIPRWQGEPLKGKRLYVKAEQGFGDNIQFFRYIEPLKKAGPGIILGVAKEVLPLAGLISGIDEFVTRDPPTPKADYYCPLLSLAHVLGDTPPGRVPCSVPYLTSEADLVEKWRAKLSRGDSLKVGIAWQGNPAYYYDYLRSIPLEFFAPLVALKGVRFFSLQKGFGAEQLETCGFGEGIVDFGDDLDGEAGPFMDTAAILTHLDLVIASDSALVHLAGAMGLPVWTLLSTPADWRWGMEGETCCWYPSMRLFRQKKSGDWPGVMEEVEKALASRLKNHNH